MTSQPTLGPIIGSQVGNYRVLRLLGSGAMGEVFLAEHPQIGSKVAVKALAPHLSADPEMGKRFMSEARAANRINHPNIIKIFDFGTLQDGRLYLVMEYLQGEELTAHLKEHAPLALGEVSELLRQITSAMAAAHQVGIIHRDLKPDNIFLHQAGGERVVKILDFGIAKLTQGGLDGGHMTATGMIMGTPLYMSPEQAAGRVDEISPQSDLYAIGVILYQMLSGSLPIQGPTAAQILARHIAERPVPLDAVTAGLPDAVAQVVERCLQKRPVERFESTTALFAAFQAAIAGAPPALRATQTTPSDAGTGTIAYGSQPSHPSAPAAVSPACPPGDRPTVAERPGAAGQPTVAETPAALGGEPSQALGSQPTTLRSASGQSLAWPPPGQARKRRRWIAIAVGGLAAVGLAVGLLVLRSSGGAAASDRATSPEAAKTPSRPPHDQPPPRRRARRAVALPARPVLRTLRVSCRTRGARVAVQVGTHKPTWRRAPVQLTVPAGAKVHLRARRRGYASRDERLVVDKDVTVDLTLARRTWRRRARARGWTRPRHRHRRRPVGEGTLGLD